MPGLVTSKKADVILSFLERAGPAPFDAIVVGTGFKKGDVNRSLNILRGAGYAYPQIIDGIEFWIPVSPYILFDDPRYHELLSWFVARLQQAGGQYRPGIAKYPKGKEAVVEINGSEIKTGDFIATLEELKTKLLIERLRLVI